MKEKGRPEGEGRSPKKEWNKKCNGDVKDIYEVCVLYTYMCTHYILYRMCVCMCVTQAF